MVNHFQYKINICGLEFEIGSDNAVYSKICIKIDNTISNINENDLSDFLTKHFKQPSSKKNKKINGNIKQPITWYSHPNNKRKQKPLRSGTKWTDRQLKMTV